MTDSTREDNQSSTDDSSIERDDELGASRLRISETVNAYAYDDQPGAITVDVDAIDRAPYDATHANLSLEDARQLRADIDAAFAAIRRENEHYDAEEATDE